MVNTLEVQLQGIGHLINFYICKMIILDCNSLSPDNGTNYALSIVSITLGILSIGVSIWLYVLSTRLSNKTTQAIDEIKAATTQLKDMHSKYVEVIFTMFKHDHEKLIETQYKNLEKGGKEPDVKKQ
jgi:hypothetical protein